MKKKMIISLLLILGAISGGMLIWATVFYVRGGEIRRDILNQFSYVVYSDYVTLIEYHGSKSEVEIPDSLWGRPVKEIGKYCFEYNEMETVIIPDSVEDINIGAFCACLNLKKIEGGKSVRDIGDLAFSGCSRLENVGQMGESIEQIFEQAFDGCKKLQNFQFGDNLRLIGNYAFISSGIAEVSLPEQVVLGTGIFMYTPWMEQQKDEFVVLNDVLISYQGTEEVVYIPEGIKGVAYNFEKSPNVREVYIPASVRYISGSISSYDSVERIYIPSEVGEIGIYQFYKSDDKTLVHIWNRKQTTIVTTAGSPAESYAKEMGYKCEIVEPWW